jgi:hypothetical protein
MEELKNTRKMVIFNARRVSKETMNAIYERVKVVTRRNAKKIVTLQNLSSFFKCKGFFALKVLFPTENTYAK